MLKFADPLAFDMNGVALHKGDICSWTSPGVESTGDPAETFEVEILNLPSSTKACVILPDGTVDVKYTAHLLKVDKTRESAPNFSEEQPTIVNPEASQGQVKLLTPNDLIINLSANMLLGIMRGVNKAVRPIQYKIDRIARTTLAETGMVMRGHVDCQVQVQDNGSARRGTMNLRLAIVDGTIKAPSTFEVNGTEYPITVEGFTKWLDIPTKPYYSKRPTDVIRSNRDTY